VCVTLAQYLWEGRNFVWLFEHVLFPVECVGEECFASNGEVGVFSLLTHFRPYIPCNSRDDFLHRGRIGHH
jgi:hypothetical protein